MENQEVPAGAQQPQPQVVYVERKPEKKRPSCLGMIGGAVVVIIVLGAVSSMGNKGATSTSGSGGTAAASPTPSQFVLGQAIQFNNHALTVNSVQKAYDPHNQFEVPTNSADEFVLVSLTVKNTGSSDLDVNTFGMKLEDDSGTQRDSSVVSVDNGLQSVTLSAGGTVTGNVVFEAKKGSAKLVFHYDPGIAGGSAVSVNLQ